MGPHRGEMPKGLSVGQVAEEGGRAMSGKFLERMQSGCDRQRIRTHGPGALDVMRRIADNPDRLRREFHPVQFAGAPERMPPEVISALGIIGESAEAKVVPDPMMAE